MTILWMDGFDVYASMADVGLKGYNTFTGNTLQTGRFTGQCYRNTTGLSPLAFGVTSGDTKSIGFAFRDSDLSTSSTGKAFMTFRGTGQTVDVCKLGVDVNGALVFGRADFTTNKICNSANGVIAVNVWNYIEVELTRSATVGVVNVKCNGTVVATASAANTGAVAVDGISLFADFVQGSRDVDDLYVIDVATALGESRIDVIRPSADTAQKDWTPSTGVTNFNMVNETLENQDTNYVADGTVGHKDLYDVTDLSFSPSVVRAVQTLLFAKKDDATTRSIRNNLKSGATTANGTTRAMGASYAMFTDLYATDPNTAAAWSASAVNAAQLGIEVVV
jgi:hypothetical protein